MTATVPEALKGNTGIYFKLGGVQYEDTKSVDVTGEDADDSDLTFLEAAQGGSQVDSVNVTAIQSTVTGSLWRYLWENAGDEVSLVYGPHGNAVATDAKPHFLMTVKLGLRPKIGGEAKRGKERQDFETTFEVTDGPELVTGV